MLASGTRALVRVDARARRRADARGRAVDLDFDARARPREESAASALVAALVAVGWGAASARLGPERSRLARVVVGAVVAVLGRAVAMRFFIERAHRDRGLSVREAADADGRFADADGLAVHYKAVARAGATRAVECMHGFGANVSSWTTSGAMMRLSEALNADVAAHDSCGFGLTERSTDVKRYTRASDARACGAILREIGADGKSVTLIGHSLGAVSAALASAAGGVDYVVLVSPAILGGKLKPIDERGGALSRAPLPLRLLFAYAQAALATLTWSLLVLTKPLMVVFLRALVRSKEFWTRGLRAAIHPSRIATMSADWIDGYRLPKVIRDWESGMFRVVLASVAPANSVGEIWRDAIQNATRTTTPSVLETEDAVNALADSGAKILIVHGEDDKIVPLSNSKTLAKLLGAELRVVRRCGHMCHEECVDEFVDIVRDFIIS